MDARVATMASFGAAVGHASEAGHVAVIFQVKPLILARRVIVIGLAFGALAVSRTVAKARWTAAHPHRYRAFSDAVREFVMPFQRCTHAAPTKATASASVLLQTTQHALSVPASTSRR